MGVGSQVGWSVGCEGVGLCVGNSVILAVGVGKRVGAVEGNPVEGAPVGRSEGGVGSPEGQIASLLGVHSRASSILPSDTEMRSPHSSSAANNPANMGDANDVPEAVYQSWSPVALAMAKLLPGAK